MLTFDSVTEQFRRVAHVQKWDQNVLMEESNIVSNHQERK
jgi:hypothetical protein